MKLAVVFFLPRVAAQSCYVRARPHVHIGIPLLCTIIRATDGSQAESEN